MANTNAPFGLSPVKYANGAVWDGQATVYYIPSTDNNQYGVGDIVKSAAGSDAAGVPTVVKAAASDVPRGVIVGVLPTYLNQNTLVGSNLNLNVIAIPATKTAAYYVLVADDPNLIFEAQCDNTATLVAIGTINANVLPVIANPASGSPFSGTQIDHTQFATTNTFMLKVLGLPLRVGSDFTAQAKLLVKFNTHEFFGSTTAYTS
jgi:hypothetical protein